ncbi:helix-turn-helix domain-containing protein [uncultured Coprobacter sp.]|uniref:helix-turn-helix domain-containing protein n=1 Tax=uncultured Coprobacter sp. TaxID=1720550 RepID=UPI0025917ADF|nr:helix-turn-helix domain-containing protein [uncultured Coprobacter sp.]
MEIVIIEKKAFEALLSGVGALTEKVSALHERCDDKRMSNWLDGENVCRLLHISPRTLQTLRDNRLIGFSQINRKFYYKPDEVERLLPVVDRFRTERDNP